MTGSTRTGGAPLDAETLARISRVIELMRPAIQADGGDDLQNGWEIRRLKLNAQGNAYGPNVTYGIQLTARF